MVPPFILATLLIQVFETGCSSLGSNSRQLAAASNEFSSNLYAKLSSQSGNIFYSPLSISTALAMLYYGARGNTATEMRNILGFDSAGLSDNRIYDEYQKLINLFGNSSQDYILKLANAAVVREEFPVRSEYTEGINSTFNAVVKEVDFQNNGQNVLQEINSWVKDKTRNKIEKILDDIDPLAVMILLNAVYFKGSWATQFNKNDTKMETFYNDGIGSNAKQVEMMNLKKKKFLFFQNKELKVLELPYKGKNICMRILLPVERNGILALESKLSPSFLKDIFGNLYIRKIDKIKIPKFKIEYEQKLNEILQSLGMVSAFDGSANLSGIADDLQVSRVVHKAYVEVNEEGSEAAAVTAVEVAVRILITPIDFVADRPFVFYIIDKRNEMILFCGKISEL